MNNLHRPLAKILTRDSAQEVLADKTDSLVEAVQEGLNQFVEHFGPELRQRSRARTLAGMLNDCIVHAAVGLFEQDKDVAIIDEYEGKFFVFFQKAAIRFKKVDDEESPRNYPTKRQIDATYQYLELPGVDRPTVINLGYQPDSLFMEVKSVSLICWRGRSLAWQIPLADVVQAFLFDQKGAAQHTPAPIVRPKLTAKTAANA